MDNLVYYLFIILSGSLLGIFFISVLKRVSLRLGLLIHKETPLVGGIGMALSFILISLSAFLVYQGLSKAIIGIIVSSGIMLAFGVIDDRHELSIWAKFLAQILATGLLIVFGIRTQIIYIGTWLNIIITFFWVLGITNAFNHLDVIDGLAGSVALIITLSFLIISLFNHDDITVIFSLCLASAICSFLIQNLPPAKIYMGNSGSHFLGFVLAAIAIIISYAPLERKIALASPLVILGFPIFDTAFLIFTRMIKKNLPFNKTNDHLAFRYLALGYSKKRALFAVSAFCLFFCICGITISQVSNLLGTGIIAVVILLSLVIGFKMGRVIING